MSDMMLFVQQFYVLAHMDIECFSIRFLLCVNRNDIRRNKEFEFVHYLRGVFYVQFLNWLNYYKYLFLLLF